MSREAEGESNNNDTKVESTDCFQPVISPNPVTSNNPIKRYPKIADSAFIRPFSSVIGDLTIRDNVFIAPSVSIRADEGTPFISVQIQIF